MFCKSETREQYALHVQDYLCYMLHTEGKLREGGGSVQISDPFYAASNTCM